MEVQANLILMGWDATKSVTQRMFGNVIDQVLSRTRLPVLVARLGHPINTTERVFVVVPAGAGHHEGFFENVHLVKKLADRLGTNLTVLVVGADGMAYAEQFERVEPEAPAAFRSVPDWSDMLRLLEDESSPNDLVAVPPRGWARSAGTTGPRPVRTAGEAAPRFLSHPQSQGRSRLRPAISPVRVVGLRF